MNRNKTISFGDKIFATVTMNGRTVYNFVSEQVANMADLISQLRRAMKNIHGLVMLRIRNYHQGWGEERPLMLYAPKISNYGYAENTLNAVETKPVSKRQHMLFPWEVH